MRIGEPLPLGEPSSDRPEWLVPEDGPQADLVFWGAHGGAGTTTLATWLQPTWDVELRALRCIRDTRPPWRLGGH